MNTRVPTPDAFGTLVGRQLAQKLIDLARSGSTIVDNSPVIQHRRVRPLAEVRTVICPVAQAEDRIKRFRLARAIGGIPKGAPARTAIKPRRKEPA
jgi:hypothetical protein